MKIEIKNISKSFGELKANSEIKISINEGIHALLGENGAGKSTLVKIISGQITPDSGEIVIDNSKLILGSPKESIKGGVGLLNQDPLDFGNLSILESFLVGIKDKNPFRNLSQTSNSISKLFKKYNLNFDFSQRTNSLSIGERQQVELIRLLYNGAKIIILDEPTSAFSLEQKKMMFQTLRTLSNEGIIIIFVSHKLDEIIEICDSGTILKAGKVVKSIRKPFKTEQIIEAMFENTKNDTLELVQTSSNEKFQINFEKTDLKKQQNSFFQKDFQYGSVIGIAGLQGSFNDLFVKNFFTQELSSTQIVLESKKKMSEKLFYYMPADRIERGLFSELSVLEHYGLSEASKSKILNWKNITQNANNKITEFNIKAKLRNEVNELSGGNQQRLMLSLMPESQSILLLEQPTRGLDLNSANTIWEMILERKNKDIAIFFSSTDIDEIWQYSDVIISVSGKYIMNVDHKKNLTKEMIINYVSGINE
ncbi:MAG: hypothetical protein CL738_04560 [Chloroflexi bacterium]|nr:hypothetical protein [Chloroflexota bacterium]|tara:strand:- start:3386 stop:4825 length:1440 start_codon:yes stop_codon:yes gene_type:complete